MAVDISWAFYPNYLLTVQVAMDQLQTFYEGRDIPNAFAFLLNLQNTVSFRGFEFLNYFEAVYTMPYMYLNNKFNEDGSRNYNYDHILGYHLMRGSEIGYSGYKYGPDSFVISLGTKMDVKSYSAILEILYKMHGIHGIGQIDHFGDYQNDSSYTFEHELSIVSGLDYNFLNGYASVFFRIKYAHFINYRNVEGVHKDLIALAIGISFKY